MKRRSRIRPQTIRPIGRCTRPTRFIGSPRTNISGANPTSLKSYFQTYGPVTAAIDAYTDFCGPPIRPFIQPTVRSKSMLVDTSIPQGIPLDAQNRGDPGDPNDLNHAIVITGYTDERALREAAIGTSRIAGERRTGAITGTGS